MTPGPGDLLVLGGIVAAPGCGPGAIAEDGRVTAPPADVRIAGGVIVEVGPQLRPSPGETVLHAEGCAVLPGLHDHHLHLRALVAARRSVAVGPDEVRGGDELAAALREAPLDARGWRRAVGYHESVAGPLDRWALDALVPGAKLRVQHRSGALWVLSSAALAELDVDAADHEGIERDDEGRATGRLWRMDGWLAARLQGADALDDVAPVSAELASLGVTGCTDTTPEATAESVAGLAAAVAEGRIRQRLELMAPPGVAVPAHPLVRRVATKVMLDDDRLPGPDELAATIRSAHEAGSPVAVHCVTAVQLALTMAALSDAGPRRGDRVEHASVVPAGAVAGLAGLGVTVVSNPGLVHARGDTYLREVEERELDDLYRCASLRSGGVVVAAGTDAPFGPADPWVAVDAAHRRRTAGSVALGADEAVPLADAVALFTGHGDDPGRHRRIDPGAPGDLVVLDGISLPAPAGAGTPVRATVVAGEVVHQR